MRRAAFPPGLSLVCLLGAMAACLPACRSVYDTAKQELTPDLQDRLHARVRAARSAAAAALAALGEPPSEERAENAAWDLSKATDSIEDVLERMSEPPLNATEVQRSMGRASKALDAAVDGLSSVDTAKAADSVDRARESLRAAVQTADEFLKMPVTGA